MSACGDGGSVVGASAPTSGQAPPDPTQRYEVTTTVLESPEHGPQLCLGGVAESYPPQCGGPDLVGWDWEAVEHESAIGTTWGDYRVVGTWDGEVLTLTEPPSTPTPSGEAGDPVDFSAPCPPPEGGWAPVDAARTTPEALDAAASLAPRLEGHGALWLDQSPAGEPITEETANDPARLVLVVTTTGDLDGTEAALREVWGGALCVAPATRTAAEVEEVHQAARERVDTISSWADTRAGQVVLGVTVSTPELQQSLDEEFGPGVVRLEGALRPVQ